MALNDALYRELINAGVAHHAALRLADPANDTISSPDVTDASNAVAAPTKAEFDALVAKFNSLLASLRTAGVIG